MKLMKPNRKESKKLADKLSASLLADLSFP